ncbi:AMP-dependent synthetase/ligase [Ferruginibacter albus]|uniref:AMP-dependent synthetase/ligase n=1 Tax=Ferruginibacter albus TaxID=2875540 RepID=UPI001CC421D5|nr:long-chain fatty acid--CoA ligase [Ferruginibacter albus]UAY52194.1 long-chain fatty acid--CoA ligase [Ferruginibacter albus]
MIDHKRLFDLLQYQLDKFPKNDMLVSKEEGEWKPYSTSEVKAIVDALSAGLLQLGLSGNNMQVDQQDKIALISKNRPEWIFLDLACQQIGVILCPVYPTTNPNELEFIFNDAAVKYIFISGEDILHKVNSIQHNVNSLKAIYSFDKLQGALYWKDLLLANQNDQQLDAIKATILPQHCATIIYTSGTTGTPKGVMLSHYNVVSNVFNSKESFPFADSPNGKALSFLPLNHIFERMVSYIYIVSGISIYYAQSMDTIGDDLKEVNPTLFCTVPRLLEKVFEKIMAKGAELKGIKKKLFYWSIALADKYNNRKSGGVLYDLQLAIANKLVFSKWREALGNKVELIVTGGAACQVRLIRLFTAAKIPIYEGYGPTENSPVICVNRKDDAKFGTVGPCINGQELKLEADGEICVKGPSVMMGYYKRPDLTAETIINDWLHTGDIGELDSEGFLKITDRKKELFKTSGGKYVAPQPIENRLKENPLIEQAMVIGAERKFTAALIVPSFTHLKEWIKQNGLSSLNDSEIVHDPKVLELFSKLINEDNQAFNHVEQIKKFVLLPVEWTIETGELTPTLKLKRKVILEKFKDEIEKIYG